MKKQPPQSSKDQKSDVVFPVVGIGASAGGLEAYTQLLQALPLHTGMAFVLVQHLDPKHKSSLFSLLAKTTKLPVNEIEDGVKLQPDHIYVITANTEVTISNARLKSHKRQQSKQPNLPIDRFLTSLAEDQKHNAVGVILSGTAHDGTKGMQAIKAAGGTTFAQDESAEFPGMPQSAIDEDVVDFVLPPARIAKKLARIGKQLAGAGTSAATKHADDDSKELTEILNLLNKYTATDLSQYKVATLRRRITRRLILHNLDNLSDYVTYLKKNHSEADALQQDMMINVTSFFRDTEMTQQLKKTILPALVASRVADKPLRMWIAGCASGEEAYSLAITTHEFLDKRSLKLSVQIFATDLSVSAIATARTGVYSREAVKGLSEQQIKQFFSLNDNKYQIAKTIRDMCIFAPHNLAADPPFSNLDIISCCNVLIYMQPVLQQKLLRKFHYALKPDGYLVLGSSETVGSSSTLFSQVDKKHKLYTRKDVPTPPISDKKVVAITKKDTATISTMNQPEVSESSSSKAADSLLLSRYVPASVVIDNDMEIVQFRGDTNQYLQPASGKASLNLLKMARSSLAFELRNAVSKVRKSHKAFTKDGIMVKDQGTVREITIEVMPLPASGNDHLLIIFTDTATTSDPAKSDKASKGASKKTKVSTKDRQIASLEAELESGREDLNRLMEEKEAFNEELQSSNEEITSSNEELQTLNEELETTSEELQSTNEELTTMNQELRDTNEQVNTERKYAEEITETIREPLIILGADLCVISANENFYKTFKVLKKHTEGQIIYRLGNDQWDIPALRELLEKILPERSSFNDFEVTHDFPDIGRKNMLLNARQIDHKQLILLAIQDITERREAAHALQTSAKSLRFMAQSMPQKVFTADPNGKADYINPQWGEYTGLSFDDISKWDWTKFVHPDDVDENLKHWKHSLKSGEPFYLEHRFRRADGVYRWHLSRATAMRDEQGKIIKWMGSNTDIDDLKNDDDIRDRLELLTKQRNALIKLNKIKSEFTALASHQLRTPATAVKQYISLLIDEYAGEVSADQLQYLQIAYDSNERQLTVIDDLLKTVQLDSNEFKLNKESQNIIEIVSDVIAELKHTFELRKQAVKLDASKKNILAVVDVAEIKLVMINLLENASKYTYHGKNITVEVAQKKDKVQISVIDQGVGISKSDSKRIFDKFTRVNNELSDTVSGTGLGLYWVKRIVKLHKGKVEVISAPKKGSTFRISLPQ